MTDKKDLLAITHGGENPDLYMRSVVPPVFMNSLHVYETTKAYSDVDIFDDQFYYGRASNPTVSILEKKLCELERGNRAVAFSAGMAACTAAIMATSSADSHIICLKDVYGPVYTLLTEFLVPKMGIRVTFIDGLSLNELESAIEDRTSLIILESPASMVFSVVDLVGISEIAKRNNVKTYIDNTYSTPLYQKPLEMGIDIVMHTLTKYIGGHSDLIGGILISNDDELMRQIMVQRDWFGSVLGPMEAWLAIRGLRSMPMRLKQHHETALAVAHFLESHPKIEKVNYTGLESHPQYALARNQQKGECGLLSFETKGGPESAVRLADNLKIFSIGASWGGFESLVMAATYSWPEEKLIFNGYSRNIVRIHCGLEGTENLIADLEQALAKI